MPLTASYKSAVAPLFEGKEETFASVLVAALVKTYGVEVLEWDGLTLQIQVKEDFGVDMPRVVYDKMMALITAITTDRFYREVPVFDESISAIAGEGIVEDNDAPSVFDVAWAVTEIQLNDPEPVFAEKGKTPFSRNVQKYVRVVLDDEGMSIPPQCLKFASKRPDLQEGADDPAMFAAAWGSKQKTADEVDAWIDRQIGVLAQHMQKIGINIMQKTAAVDATGTIHDIDPVVFAAKAVGQYAAEKANQLFPSYEPPMNESQVRQKFEQAKADELLKDPVHNWRATSGVELMHDTPSKEELDRVWKNWQLMSDEQKAQSEAKSQELHGSTNEALYNKLLAKYTKTAKVELGDPLLISNGFEVHRVVGEDIRKEHTEFVGGDHGNHADWLPEHVFIVENLSNPEDEQKILGHELIEWALMRKGMSYEKAHTIATNFEKELRDGKAFQEAWLEFSKKHNIGTGMQMLEIYNTYLTEAAV